MNNSISREIGIVLTKRASDDELAYGLTGAAAGVAGGLGASKLINYLREVPEEERGYAQPVMLAGLLGRLGMLGGRHIGAISASRDVEEPQTVDQSEPDYLQEAKEYVDNVWKERGMAWDDPKFMEYYDAIKGK